MAHSDPVRRAKPFDRPEMPAAILALRDPNFGQAFFGWLRDRVIIDMYSCFLVQPDDALQLAFAGGIRDTQVDFPTIAS